MNSSRSKIHALAATARISNVPSVLSNVWAGIILATILNDSPVTPSNTLLVSVCSLALYVSGNFFNDWADHEWDKSHRPERGLPQKLFQPRHYLLTAVLLALVALACAAGIGLLASLVACSILVAIAVYTWSHKRTPWSVLPMGICRGLLPVLGFYAASGTHELPRTLTVLGISATCYIISLSLSARTESMAASTTWQAISSRLWFIPAPVMLAATLIFDLNITPLIVGIGVTPYLAWIALCIIKWRKPVHRHVSNLLAGIPLVDSILLIPIGFSNLSHGSMSLACITVPVLAVILGKSLQRFAPAT